MVLADTSVWIAHFKKGEPRLEALLMDGEIACHPFIIGELACGNLKNRQEILRLLTDLPETTGVDDDEVLTFIDRHRLSGTGLGYIDIHLLVSSLISGVPLWTLDSRLSKAAIKLGTGF